MATYDSILLISLLLYFCFQNAHCECNFQFLESWSTLAYLILGFLTIILNRQYPVKKVVIKVTLVFILLAIIIVFYGHFVGISYIFTTASMKAPFYENISPFLIPLCALAYALPFLIIVPFYLRNAKFKIIVLKYILLIPLMVALMLSSIILNAIVFFGLLDYCST